MHNFPSLLAAVVAVITPRDAVPTEGQGRARSHRMTFNAHHLSPTCLPSPDTESLELH